MAEGDASREGGGLDPAGGSPPPGDAIEKTAIGRPARGDLALAATIGATGTDERPLVEEAAPVSAFDPSAERFGELGELGRGGMGRVIDVFDRMLSRRVAVKQMLATDRMAFARFEREARITARLEHPGIVPVYEAGRNADGTPYYIMRRIDGVELRDAVKRASFDERLACVPNVLAACDAVAYAHARSIVHRDLKPTNILLGQFGETLVIDWGLAYVLHEPEETALIAVPRDHGLTLAGQVMGTPGFMAPEQARGEPADARADVFALGATLFYVLSGTPPYGGDSAQEVVSKIASGSSPDWSRLPDGVPADLRTILTRALAISAGDRYPDAGALAADLRAFVTGNLVAAHRYSWFEQLHRWVHRHRAIVALSLLSLAAISIVITLAVHRVIAERDATEVARQHEAERADDLTLAQARTLLEINPTFAVATAAPLVERGRWRHVHNIVSAARARGVAWRLPASAKTCEIQLSPDGLYGGSVGTDGVIRIYNLRARTVHATIELGGKLDDSRHVHLRLLGGTSFAVFDRGTLTLHGSTGQRKVAIAAPVRKAVTAAGALYWIDIEKHVWQLARDGTAPTRIALDEPAYSLAVSLDGSQIALGGRKGGWLADTASAMPAQRISNEPFDEIAWDPHYRHGFLATTFSGLVAVRTDSTPPTSKIVGPRAPMNWQIGDSDLSQLVAMNGSHYLVTPGFIRTDQDIKYYSGTRGIGLATARDEIVASATADGRIELQFGPRTHELLAPGPLELVEGASSGSFLLGAGGSDVWLWNLDDFVPRLAASQRTYRLGPHHALTDTKGQSTWIDLKTGATHAGPMRTDASLFQVGPSRGDRVLVITDKIARILRINTTDDTEVAKAVNWAAWLRDGRLLIAFDNHSVGIVDPMTGNRTPVSVPPGREVYGVLSFGSFIVIRFRDGSCIRMNLHTSVRTETRCSQNGFDVHLASDGTLWFVDGPRLHAWRTNGRVDAHAMLPKDIYALFVIDDSHLVLDTKTAGYLIDLKLPFMMRSTMQLYTLKFPNEAVYTKNAMGESIGIIVVKGRSGGATVLDGLTGVWWRIGQSASAFLPADLSEDGTVFYELRGVSGLWALPIDPPREARATTRLIESLTNVTADDALRRRPFN